MFWGSFGGLKTYSEQKRFLGQDFQSNLMKSEKEQIERKILTKSESV